MSDAVNDMFTGIARHYDLANDILSVGTHRQWRTLAVRESGAFEGANVLDCATGTGDLALAFKRVVGRGRVVGTDFNADMIQLARPKANKRGLDIEFSQADAMHLPFADGEFDVVSIAFGIRNVDDPHEALLEMARVAKPGGCAVVLEFGKPKGLLGVVYRMYSRYVMPMIGALITGHRKAYEYLPETAARFPSGSEFESLMVATGAFANIRKRSLSGGIAWIYVGIVSNTSRQ